MRRRDFTSGLAGALAIGHAWAQPARRIHRIGIVGLSATSDLVGPTPRSPTLHAFLNEMRQLGYVYGENFVTEVRGSAGKSELLPSFAAELIAGQVDVIVATGAAVPTLKEATSTIPIVMAATSDPVRQGFVQIGRTPCCGA